MNSLFPNFSLLELAVLLTFNIVINYNFYKMDNVEMEIHDITWISHVVGNVVARPQMY